MITISSGFARCISTIQASAQMWGMKAAIIPEHPSAQNSSTPDFGFAWQVAFDSSTNTVVAGSYHGGEYDYNARQYLEGHGSARIFKRQSSSSLDWQQEAQLVGIDENGNSDYAGYAVAVSGDTVLISAILLSDYSHRCFIFVRSGLVWTMQQILFSEDSSYADDGRVPRVAIEGDVAVIGRGHGGAGRVFVYQRNDTIWTLDQTLEASDGANGDYFGAGMSSPS